MSKFNFFLVWVFGFFALLSFDLFVEAFVFEWLAWNGTDKNDWFFVMWWGCVVVWFIYGIKRIFFKISYDLPMKKFIAIVLSFLLSSCAVSLGNTDNMQRTVVSNLTPEYACIISHHFSHHEKEVPTDIKVYLEVTDTNCEALDKHLEKKQKKAEEPEEEEELIKKKRFY